jgi:hypothetical protein
LNVICALAPNPVTAARFLYVENIYIYIVQTNLHRLSLNQRNKKTVQSAKNYVKKNEIFQYFRFICSLAPGVLFNFQLFDIDLKA